MERSSQNQLLVLNATNYQNYPLGGALGTIKLFLENTRFSPWLVGITNDLNHKIGEWTSIDVHRRKLPYLAVANTRFSFIPHKVLLLFGIIAYRKKITKKICGSQVNVILFVNREAYLPARLIFKNREKLNVFFKMTETGNPLEISERKIGHVKLLQSIYLQMLIKPMLKAASVIFSINNECRTFCETHLLSLKQRRKITDIHHYIDYKSRRNDFIGAKKVKKKEHHRIIFWGRLAYVKGLDLVVDSVERLKIEGMQIECLIIGDGSSRQSLEANVNRRRLQNEIRFLGKKPISEIAAFAKNTDVFVMASHTEGIPTSMLEAMTFELPVVSTAVGGIPTLVKNGINGILIHSRDPQLFAEGIKSAIKIDRKRVAQYNTKLIKEGYAVETVVAQMDRIMHASID